MQRILKSLPLFVRRHQRAVRFTALLLLALAWGGLKYAKLRMDQPPHAKQRTRVVFNRAVGICTALGDACTIDTHPSFSARRAANYPGDCTPLHMWKVGCTVDGRQMEMIFNDDTGKLAYLVASRNAVTQPANRPLATIDNREEAAEVGFQRLKAMKLLPQGSLVALNGIPSLSRIHDVWEMTWKVKANLKALPYTIRLVLDRNSHMPVSVVDTSNLNVRG